MKRLLRWLITLIIRVLAVIARRLDGPQVRTIPHHYPVLIHSVEPAPPYCLLRDSPHPRDRRLEVIGTAFPATNHGLQFRHLATGDLSIIFDMEVNWESTTRITVDMADIKDLLWPDSRVTLAVHVMDTTNANYRPISNWCPAFLLADDATACGV